MGRSNTNTTTTSKGSLYTSLYLNILAQTIEAKIMKIVPKKQQTDLGNKHFIVLQLSWFLVFSYDGYLNTMEN